MPICLKCNSKFPNRIEIDGIIKNMQRRKYCLNCSPFGNHNTTKLHEPKSESGFRYCPKCKNDVSIECFYQRRGKPNSSTYCKPCTNTQTLSRQIKFKQFCVDYKGGSCELCGYNKCLSALEFHHKDPAKKDFEISKSRLKKMDDETIKELDKCNLVCANCHREIHYQIIYGKFISASIC